MLAAPTAPDERLPRVVRPGARASSTRSACSASPASATTLAATATALAASAEGGHRRAGARRCRRVERRSRPARRARWPTAWCRARRSCGGCWTVAPTRSASTSPRCAPRSTRPDEIGRAARIRRDGCGAETMMTPHDAADREPPRRRPMIAFTSHARLAICRIAALVAVGLWRRRAIDARRLRRRRGAPPRRPPPP